jgi:hypothetical protein
MRCFSILSLTVFYFPVSLITLSQAPAWESIFHVLLITLSQAPNENVFSINYSLLFPKLQLGKTLFPCFLFPCFTHYSFPSSSLGKHCFSVFPDTLRYSRRIWTGRDAKNALFSTFLFSFLLFSCFLFYYFPVF